MTLVEYYPYKTLSSPKIIEVANKVPGFYTRLGGYKNNRGLYLRRLILRLALKPDLCTSHAEIVLNIDI